MLGFFDGKRDAFLALSLVALLNVTFWACRLPWSMYCCGLRRREASPGPTMFGMVHDEVCIVGNSQNLRNAVKVHKMWGSMFPSFWYLWGQEEVEEEFEDIPFLYTSRGTLPFVGGLETMIGQAVQSNHRCRWVFTHDDDLVFRFSEIYRPSTKEKTTIAEHLLSVLRQYDPVVAGFPWDGLQSPAMSQMQAAYANSSVRPLTGFDNGMVLYRRDVLDLVVPFMPRGEGGFFGNWTLGAHFLNLLLPLALRESAVCVHSLAYANTVNLDVALRARPPGARRAAAVRWEKGDLVMVEGSRHPYEYKLNARYTAFLRGGLKCLDCPRHGKDLLPADVAWAPRRAPPLLTPEDLLRRLGAFYDLRHAALSNTALVRGHPGLVARVLADTRITLQLFVFTYNRPQAFARLWADLGALAPPDSLRDGRLAVELHVHKDLAPGAPDYVPAAPRHPLGPVVVHRAGARRGLLRQMLKAWEPAHRDTYGVFLEDDVRVSPAALLYLDLALRSWKYSLDYADPRVAGFSLYNQAINEVTNRHAGLSFDGTPALWCMPQTWGAAWDPVFWSEFLAWQRAFTRDLPSSGVFIESSFTNRWPRGTSYKKALLRFMRLEGYGLVYPNLPDRLSFTDAHAAPPARGEQGQHAGARAPPQYVQREPMELVRVEDMPQWQAIISSRGGAGGAGARPALISPWEVAARRWEGSAADYERLVGTCTLLIMTTRGKYLRRSLAHYSAARGLFSEILVVWNDPHLPFPAWKDEAPRPPPGAPAVRWLRMRDGHMDNRFTLYGEVGTECVVVADDDIVVPHNATRFAFRVWRGDFFQQIVGHRYFARAHALDRAQWRYVSPDHRAHEWSMVLPGAGTIFHRELLRHFVHPYLAPARQVVADTHNCDDILVNFLATSVSGRGPVVLHVLGWAEVAAAQLSEAAEAHLSARRGHFADRDGCLAKFFDFFGRTRRALVFTTSAFSVAGAYGASQLPGRQHYRSTPDVVDSWVGAPMQEGQQLWYMPPLQEEGERL